MRWESCPSFSPSVSISVAHSISYHWDGERHACIPDLHKETRRCCYSCMLSRPHPQGAGMAPKQGCRVSVSANTSPSSQPHLAERRGERLSDGEDFMAWKIKQKLVNGGKQTNEQMSLFCAALANGQINRQIGSLHHTIPIKSQETDIKGMETSLKTWIFLFSIILEYYPHHPPRFMFIEVKNCNKME